MARLEPRSITARDGKSLIVRSPLPGEAAALIELSVDAYATSEYLGTETEVDRDVAKEEAKIRELLEKPDWVSLVAFADGVPVGRVNFRANSKQRIAHHGHLGMYTRSAWRGRGVGRALLGGLIEWAREHPTIEMLCLGVMAPNTAAIKLYESAGFLRSDWRTRFFKFGPDRYIDDIRMYLPVKLASGRVEPGVGVEVDLHAPPEGERVLWQRTSAFEGSRRVRLPSGVEMTVRRPVEDDAAALIAHARDVFKTSDYTGNTLAEYEKAYDEPKERAWIAEMNAGEGTLALVADGPGGIAGMLSFRAEPRQRMAHWGNFGIGVNSAWRGRGVGKALIAAMMDWAADHPTIEKVCLGVMAANRGAYRLYHNMGFRAEGLRPREFRLGPDRYSDDVPMSLFVKW